MKVDNFASAFDKIKRKTKPPGSLGILETVAVRLAHLQQTLEPNLTEPMVGGFQIAAMTGTLLEAAKTRSHVVVDGFIATAVAATAFNIDQRSREICFFSHRWSDQAYGKALEALKAEPLLDLRMRLGEGTEVALVMPIPEAATKIFCEMATFESAGVSGMIGGMS